MEINQLLHHKYQYQLAFNQPHYANEDTQLQTPTSMHKHTPDTLTHTHTQAHTPSYRGVLSE